MLLKKLFSIIHRRGYLRNILIIALIIAFVTFVLIIINDLRIEKNLLSNRVVKIQFRSQIVESMYRRKQEDILVLSKYLIANSGFSNLSNNFLETLSTESKAIIKKSSSSMAHLRFASVYDFLAHLRDDPDSLRPALLVSKGRSGVSIVLGDFNNYSTVSIFDSNSSIIHP